ncbi:MAG: hypothetical protein U9Q82_13160 [Chloroflexota bacterium]|nr:hypothetical protein [Chloroflexota bacterium]
MTPLQSWLSKHKFKAHLTAFLLMVIPSAGLYFGALRPSTGVIWILVAVISLGNILAMLVK